ncbi:macrophage migration inhibitory factor [Musa troglodytarum]|uniref:L-dopachrome isomerase n=1 Tax=Musa troglodytarum TaxID=320322 RepID=A0A9E7GBC7_9LILI|nr:macrophage migration inhibitory factor [Musa troglodytarum]
MPTLNVSTNVPVDAVVASDILRDCTRIVAKIIGKPESVRTPSKFSYHQLFDEIPLTADVLDAFVLVSCIYAMCKNSNEDRFSAQYVMILINGGVPIAFAGSEEPAAYGEVISIGGLGPSVNAKLSSALAEILEAKLSVDGSRFYIKFYDVQRSFFGFNGSTF